MPSFDFITVKNRSKKRANDIHLSFEAQVDVTGVNGVAPSDPKFKHKLDGDGSAEIGIAKINIPPGSTITINIRGSGKTTPSINPEDTYLTLNGERLNLPLTIS
ncbi:MAG TPA: hypothetical protein VKS22_08875 [Candidatus Binataceae bacterium]|nr:hypothetical protein [Candidatus Binataceae bacterium]